MAYLKSLLVMSLMTVSSVAMADNVTVDNLTIKNGASGNVVIKLDKTSSLSQMSFVVTLPDGLKYNNFASSSRLSKNFDLSYTEKIAGTNKVAVTIFSDNNTVIPNASGELLTLNVTAEKYFDEAAQIKVSSITAATNKAEKVAIADAVASVHSPALSAALSYETETVAEGTKVYLYLSNDYPVGVVSGKITLPAGIKFADTACTETTIGNMQLKSNDTEGDRYFVLSSPSASLAASSTKQLMTTFTVSGGSESPISISDILMTNAQEKSSAAESLNIIIEEEAGLPGDANDDGVVNVLDFVAVANAILGHAPEGFNFKNAKCSDDGSSNLTIVDLQVISNIILDGSSLKAKSKAAKQSVGTAVVEIPSFTINAGGQTTVDVNISNIGNFSGYQFDVMLPTGISVKSINLSNARTGSNTPDYFNGSLMNDGSYRVLCASLSGKAFAGTEGTVATITLVADEDMETGTYSLDMNNAITAFSGKALNTTSPSTSFTVAAPTAIDAVAADEASSTDVYDVAGKNLGKEANVRRGIYIIDGKKQAK